MIRMVLVVLFVLMLLGTMPVWGYNSQWGYGPVGLSSLLLVIAVIFYNFRRV